MNEKITTEKAIQKGQKMITIPSMISMFGLMVLFYLLTENGIISKGYFLIGMLLSFLSGWIVWSIQVPKWKVWAFTHVENIEDLKKEAIDAKLIWKDSNIFTKTEIWKKEQRQTIEKLENQK